MKLYCLTTNGLIGIVRSSNPAAKLKVLAPLPIEYNLAISLTEHKTMPFGDIICVHRDIEDCKINAVKYKKRIAIVRNEPLETYSALLPEVDIKGYKSNGSALKDKTSVVRYRCDNCCEVFMEKNAKEAWDDPEYDDKNHLMCPNCESSDVATTDEELSEFYKIK